MTQKQLMDALIEKIAAQAAEIALVKHQRDLWYKHHEAMKERALQAEQMLERVERYHDSLFAHSPETGSLILEICEFLRPGSAPEFAKQKAEVGANGHT